MARPRLEVETVVVQIKLRLHPGQDDDLLEWFGQMPRRLRAPAVKAALRAGGMALVAADVPDDEEIAAVMDALLG
jgi:hypothetical protein